MKDDMITLAHGAGGREMDRLISSLGPFFRGKWKNYDDDSASMVFGDRQIVFTTDSFIVDPVFFPGGDIGQLAACGTINDLAVMGAEPLGMSVAAVIEEGFPVAELKRIMASVKKISLQAKVPIVTGDTKVMESGKLDRIILNTSGIGVAGRDGLLTKKAVPGDRIIISGGLGEHAAALLSRRFNFSTAVKSDSKPMLDEIGSVKGMIRCAKDATRGGIAAVLNEIARRGKVGMLLDEQKIPAKKEVRRVAELLGLDLHSLACEGVFVCIAPGREAAKVEKTLKGFNRDAAIIGEVVAGDRVMVQTIIGRRVMPVPSGRIVPRIC